MAPPSASDIFVGVSATAVAAIAIYLFIRASSGTRGEKKSKSVSEMTDLEAISAPSQTPSFDVSNLKTAQRERYLSITDVERAKSNIRTLSLQRELLTTVLQRLFEAEDEKEITGEERLRLSRGYENQMKDISERLKRAELVVTLNELESMREEVLKRFESTLNSTQSRIDSILKELKISEKEKVKPKAEPKKRVEKEEKVEVEEEEPREEEAEEKKREERKSEVEERIERIRQEVMKELEELERLDIEL